MAESRMPNRELAQSILLLAVDGMRGTLNSIVTTTLAVWSTWCRAANRRADVDACRQAARHFADADERLRRARDALGWGRGPENSLSRMLARGSRDGP